MLTPLQFAEVRRRAIFDCCKWDPQVEDISSLAPFPLLLDPCEWHRLKTWAEDLARETLDAEAELSERTDWHRRLGLGWRLRSVFQRVAAGGASPGAARVMRFDFHLTTDGWRISEANTDVPGGFNESSGFTELMACHYAAAEPLGDPAASYAEAILRATFPGAVVALVHATGYTDDRQVMSYLARHLEARSLRTRLVSPVHLRWDVSHARRARVELDGLSELADLVVRFFPAEWLPNLRRSCAWQHFFFGTSTPLSNPATALVTQSKRFPLVWNALQSPLRTWHALLPETRDPREVPWRTSDDWILKPAFGRVGCSIGMRGVTAETDWRKISRRARWFPGRWVAQRRFEAVPLRTERGEFYPCIGVFTIDGRATGAYGRLATRPLIDWRAQDLAVLVLKSDSSRKPIPSNSERPIEVAACN